MFTEALRALAACSMLSFVRLDPYSATRLNAVHIPMLELLSNITALTSVAFGEVDEHFFVGVAAWSKMAPAIRELDIMSVPAGLAPAARDLSNITHLTLGCMTRISLYGLSRMLQGLQQLEALLGRMLQRTWRV